ncbi:MAG TPA: DUF4259 domain-containing protein [Verrucomicrobiae bacterium]|jgi:hypothetical protein
MGAWGPNTFDNDTAMDWLHELYASGDFTLVHKTLLRLSGSPEEFTQCLIEERALAAAEIVACWLGHPPAGKEGLDQWVGKHTDWFTPEILALALETVALIKTKSQLRQMRMDNHGVVQAEWLDSIADLERRLEMERG